MQTGLRDSTEAAGPARPSVSPSDRQVAIHHLPRDAASQPEPAADLINVNRDYLRFTNDGTARAHRFRVRGRSRTRRRSCDDDQPEKREDVAVRQDPRTKGTAVVRSRQRPVE